MNKKLLVKINALLLGGNQRTVNLKRNITGSTVLRGVDILISLILVPLTITYVNPTQYGIWLTISSIIGWIGYFNIGIHLGFKNRFTETLATGNDELGKQYVSTVYALMSLIFIPVGFTCVLINQFIDWPSFIKVDTVYLFELRRTFDVLIVCFCFNMIIKIVNIMLDADQKVVWSSLIGTISHAFMLGVIYIMTISTNGSLLGLAIANSCVPLLVVLISSFVVFSHKRYRIYTPQLRNIRLNLSKSIIGLGFQFFVINLASLFLFQMINVLISRHLGPEVVSQYGISFRYFFVINQLFMIIVIPLWPAFTDAYTKGDFGWMKRTSQKVEIILSLFIPILILMLVLAPIIYHLWVGDKVTVPFAVSLMTLLYVFSRMAGDMYNHMLNGIGKVRLQTIIYVLFAIISIPAMNFFGELFGIYGLLSVPVVTMLTQAVVGRLQIRKILENRAFGLWDK